MPAAKRSTKSQPSPHDAFFRRILARPEKAAEFLRWYLPAPIVAELDLNEVSYADTTFADAKLRKHFSDLLLRVTLRDGGKAYVLILLEHKSAPDPRVAIQVLRYAALL
ncbi:MAG: ISNCY family transposase, partial [Acidobacteria bacterium]|nr:ISNCY family transposase [Acidobacteriota bacterium]